MAKQLACIQGARKFASTSCLLLAAMAGLGTGSAMAEGSKPADAWQYELTPYLWASRMDGNVKAGPLPKTSVDMKFSDILDNLDAGFMTATITSPSQTRMAPSCLDVVSLYSQSTIGAARTEGLA